MQTIGLDRTWIRAIVALCLAALVLAGGGVRAEDAAPQTTTTTATQPDIALPARVAGARSAGAFPGLISVVDRVGHSTAAVADSEDASTTDSGRRSLVATRRSLQRYAVLLVEVDDEGLDELAGLLEDLIEGVEALTAEVAAGRADVADAVAGLEDRVEAVQQRWAARAEVWETAWQQAGREWQAVWDRAAAEWEAGWAEAAAEWDAYREQAAEDREQDAEA